MDAKDMSTRRLKRKYISQVRTVWHYELMYKNYASYYRSYLYDHKQTLASIKDELSRRGITT